MTDVIEGYVNPNGSSEGNHMRSFTPTDEYHTFRVYCMVDRWEDAAGRFSRDVLAIGGTSAEQIVKDLVKADYPDATVLSTSQLCDECGHPVKAIGASPGHKDGTCQHRSYSADAEYPCPCGLDETEKRYLWGDK